MLKAALVLVAVLWAGELLAQEPARPQGTAAQDVFVPSFWDPAAIPERPPFDTSRPLRFITEDDHPPFGFLL
ncbi:MAG: ABC transporter substrate-binding protein, partial [Actinomycetospora chiangmaiensis]|nr:ABC transporter substrate-binding protein [Actinomycetospora chiangmaiensis]